jgi:FkbM family methyltransferase
MRVQLSDWIPQQLYFLGTYEEKEILFVSKTPNAGDVFIDIGANVGIFTMVASNAVGDTGKVFAFEPLAANFDKLRFHITQNNLRNVTAERLAVLDKNEPVTLFSDDRWNNDSMATAYPGSFNHQEIVNGISLDNYFYHIDVNRLSLIKIDIEGGEFPALLGMESLMRKYHPTILLEINPEVLKYTPFSENDVETFLSKLGYSKKYLDNSGNVVGVKMRSDNSCNYVFL